MSQRAVEAKSINRFKEELELFLMESRIKGAGRKVERRPG